jgi:hypothetical protein
MADFSKFKKAGKAKVDFSDAGDRGPFNPIHQEEGDYLLKIVAVLDSPTKEGNKPQWLVALQDVDNPRAIYRYNCLLEKSQAWKLRNIFVAAGKNVPQKMMNVDPQVLVGKVIGASLIDDEYNGKLRSSVDQVFPASELKAQDDDEPDDVDDDTEEEEEEDDTPPPPKKKAPAKKAPAKKKKEPEPEEDDDEDEVEDGDDEEMEVEDL